MQARQFRLTWTTCPFRQAGDDGPGTNDSAIGHLAEVFQYDEGALRITPCVSLWSSRSRFRCFRSASVSNKPHLPPVAAKVRMCVDAQRSPAEAEGGGQSEGKDAR